MNNFSDFQMNPYEYLNRGLNIVYIVFIFHVNSILFSNTFIKVYSFTQCEMRICCVISAASLFRKNKTLNS